MEKINIVSSKLTFNRRTKRNHYQRVYIKTSQGLDYSIHFNHGAVTFALKRMWTGDNHVEDVRVDGSIPQEIMNAASQLIK